MEIGRVVAAAVLLGTLLVAPFYVAHRTDQPSPGFLNVPMTHDMAQHVLALRDLDKGLRAGNYYPRWQSDFNAGYGLPWLNYYSPGFYYASEVVHLALPDAANAFFFVSLCCMVGSGLALYYFLRFFYSPVSCAVAAGLYMVAPYHMLDLYHRGALPEFAGFFLVPLVFVFVFLTATRGRPQDYAGLAVSYGLQLFTHLPVGYLMTLTLAIYVLLWAAMERDWRIPVRVAAGGTLGALLSAIYWLPALRESRFIQEYYTVTFPYADSFLPVSVPGHETDVLMNQFFIAHVVTLLAAIVAWRFLRPAGPSGIEGPSVRLHTRLLTVMGIAVTLMATPLASGVSRVIPKLEQVLFPWRWLVVGAFLGVVPVAAAVERLRGLPASPRKAMWTSVIAMLLAGNAWAMEHTVMRWALQNPDLPVPATRVDTLFFPAGAASPQILRGSAKARLVNGGGSVQVVRWEPFYREISVDLERAATLRLRTYNFPGWIGRLDGQPAEVHSDHEGIQILELPAGRHRVEVLLVNTPVQTAGAVISGLALCVICGLLLAGKFRAIQRP